MKGLEEIVHNSAETAQEWTDIQEFMTKRRAQVLLVLRDSGRLSQGELARKINAKPTALSNLLIRFDNFTPALLEKEYEGKYCYYTLSEWGRRYVEKITPKQASKVLPLQEREDEILYFEAKSCIVDLMNFYGDEWQSAFDDVLVHYTRNSRCAPDRNLKRQVNQYLRSLELLTVHQNDRLRNQTLALLTNPILSSRIAEFMDQLFDPLSIVLTSLQDRSQAAAVSRALRFVFTGRKERSTEADLVSIGWTEKTVRSLDRVAKRIRECLAGFESEDVDDFFSALLPDQEILCALIRQLVLET